MSYPLEMSLGIVWGICNFCHNSISKFFLWGWATHSPGNIVSCYLGNIWVGKEFAISKVTPCISCVIKWHTHPKWLESTKLGNVCIAWNLTIVCHSFPKKSSFCHTFFFKHRSFQKNWCNEITAGMASIL